MDVINWITAHWTDITTIIAYTVATASIVVKLTPTVKDDQILANIIRILDMLAINTKEEKVIVNPKKK